LRDVLQSKDPKSAQAIEQIMTYGLPKENARKVLADVQATGVIPAQADQSITDQIAENRRLKDRLNRVELLLEKRNTQVMRMLNHLQEAPLLPDPELIRVVNQIYEISRMTEHEYRLWQIRSAIETRVLSGL
jgi:thiamine biosynthesis lipoprotein ApbE